MIKNGIKCFKCVGEENRIIKYGKSKSGKQRYLCKVCNQTCVEDYTYNAYHPDLNQKIIVLTKEGLGIRSTARVLKISTTTLLGRIISIALGIKHPLVRKGRMYELDKLRTFVKSKDRSTWLIYAIDRNTRQVVSFRIGSRTNKVLKTVVDTLVFSEAQTIFTDKLRNYQFLISKRIHSVKARGTNYIERCNLTLRTHLKRLSRKTLCFSKSLAVLSAIVKIYFWG